MTHNKEKNQSVETDPQITEIMGLAEKVIKTAKINMFQMLKNIKKTMNIVKRN